jgi:hypothetical protein
VSNPPDWSPRDGVPDYMVGIDLLFTLAVPLDLLGVLDMNVGLGMLVLAPGFLFEFVVLPLWLIVKGFTTPSSITEFKSPALATAR